MAHAIHRKKKRFQTSLDSYFGKPRNQDNWAIATSSPPLPADIQASLLNVGMRVRKSVPEGYKTHKTALQSLTVSPASIQLPQSYGASRELMPFSGLHKIGGYAQQTEWLPSSAPALLECASYDSLPSLTSSQSTTSSRHSFQEDTSGGRKRTFDEEMEEEMDLFFDEMDRQDELAARKIAQPRRHNPAHRLLQILDEVNDFPEVNFLQPDIEIDMSEDT